jgi:hypothetical protein
MITQEEIIETESSLVQRRAFMKLPLAERRKILAAQAEKLLAHYEEETAIDEREIWQGGDVIEQ